MRDNMLAADRVRFGGANQDLLWNAFARRGMGETAASDGPPTPTRRRASASPCGKDARSPAARRARRRPGQLYVGDYEARAMPIADTDPATPRSAR